MHEISASGDPSLNKASFYAQLREDVSAILTGERDWIANTANCAAVLYHALRDVNWAGFYFLQGEELVLGPFQGKPACVRIGPGRGVCGAAVVQRQTLVVPNVHEFPGHIACDCASNAEIVVPLIVGDRIIGVLDIDSPVLERFSEEDAAGLESIVACLLSASEVGG
ncbi:GAF domain-containing protein [Blastopirellula sp. JC732]|uniref:GAF domain-containing protein n=1 Tax=Blastopirellula sediminis TaxID=2894196 RepID=A0A9X1SJ87_9BACT|nr:GAF domain-containing protein [Blastopirellula sediminis]MCC9604604.1 GAF domain-containing protein [Blastopirellula sediminis]MCC9632097.1 GAF domain-containing protein [Blastopirellula sediminis]